MYPLNVCQVKKNEKCGFKICHNHVVKKIKIGHHQMKNFKELKYTESFIIQNKLIF